MEDIDMGVGTQSSVPIETQPAKPNKRPPIFMDNAEREWAIKRLAEDTEIIGECMVWRGQGTIGRKNKKLLYFRLYAAAHNLHVPDEYMLIRSCATKNCFNKQHVTIVHKPHDKASLLSYLQTNARQEGQCLINDWIGCDMKGYGWSKWNKKSYQIHRLVFWANSTLYEDIEDIPKDLVVAHGCRNKTCTTPAHYRLATQVENSADRIRDGTSLRGSINPNAKITLKQAQGIADSWADVPKMSQIERAEKFGVSYSLVAKIDQRTMWEEVVHPNGRAWQSRRPEKRKSCKKRSELGTFTLEECEELRAKITNRKNLTIDDQSGCWTVPLSTVIRPTMKFRGVTLLVSIFACIINNDGIDEPDKDASHHCGNARCINPEHLVFKMRKDNARDKYIHGSGKHKLSIEAVREIRSLPHLCSRDLAKRFKVSVSNIHSVRGNRNWQDHIIDQVEKEHLETRAQQSSFGKMRLPTQFST